MNYKLSVSPNFSRLMFAKWVLTLSQFRNGNPVMSVPRALEMADDLIRGGVFEAFLFKEEKELGEAFCTITEIPYVDPYAEDRRIQAEYFALRDRGAAGDAEAAIAYCKLEVQGLPNHGAMA
jgi:hypothetical protein